MVIFDKRATLFACFMKAPEQVSYPTLSVVWEAGFLFILPKRGFPILKQSWKWTGAIEDDSVGQGPSIVSPRLHSLCLCLSCFVCVCCTLSI